jgi:hypothetical protein
VEMKKRGTAIKLILLIIYLLNFSALSIAAKGIFEEESTENMLYVRGLISKVYADKMQISVKPFKSKRVLITLGPDTILDGVSQISQFEKEQQVKVWYSTDNGDNQAIKIKKMMKIGC